MNRGTLLLVAVALLALACAPAAPPPSAAPNPAGQTAGASGASTSAAWDQLVEAAKREGKVAVVGPIGTGLREALTEPFQRRYGVEVEYLAEAGRGLGPRLSNERGAGQFLWDVFIGGTTTGLTALVPLGALDPLDDYLVHPDTKDGKLWRGGALDFIDDDRRILGMTTYQHGTFVINTNQVRADEFKAHRDLLDAKWRGRIVMDDPRRAGAGQATFTFFYLHPGLGPEFIRALARQDLTIMSDYTQELDAVGHGRFPVLVGFDNNTFDSRSKTGIPVAVVNPRQLAESTDITTGVGNVGVFNRAPHPNAAKLYVNWLLSKEGQQGLADNTYHVSNRLDVPVSAEYEWRVPNLSSVKTHTQDAMDIKDDLVEFLQEVYGR
jgi:iron(III) transport system substrate-binding protein